MTPEQTVFAMIGIGIFMVVGVGLVAIVAIENIKKTKINTTRAACATIRETIEGSFTACFKYIMERGDAGCMRDCGKRRNADKLVDDKILDMAASIHTRRVEEKENLCDKCHRTAEACVDRSEDSETRKVTECDDFASDPLPKEEEEGGEVDDEDLPLCKQCYSEDICEHLDYDKTHCVAFLRGKRCPLTAAEKDVVEFAKKAVTPPVTKEQAVTEENKEAAESAKGNHIDEIV